jgi:hypothetical protein
LLIASSGKGIKRWNNIENFIKTKTKIKNYKDD